MTDSQTNGKNVERTKKKNFLEHVREVLRRKHYSRRTEEAYVGWIYRYIMFHNKQHPKNLGTKEVEDFLTHLAQNDNVAPATQNQALNGVAFLYREVLGTSLDMMQINPVPAEKKRNLPLVLAKDEVKRVISAMSGQHQLMAKLLYGSGMSLMECLRLRVQDVDFENNAITVRNGNDSNGRKTFLPDPLQLVLKEHLERVKIIHEKDLVEGYGSAYVPDQLAEKYPDAAKAWSLQFVFPAASLSMDPVTGRMRRHHIHETSLQKAIKQATKQAGLEKKVSPQTLRHCFATHLLMDGADIRTIQGLLGHKNVQTTMIYIHILQEQKLGKVKSPLDF